jgi:hypothetical protein
MFVVPYTYLNKIRYYVYYKERQGKNCYIRGMLDFLNTVQYSKLLHVHVPQIPLCQRILELNLGLRA